MACFTLNPAQRRELVCALEEQLKDSNGEIGSPLDDLLAELQANDTSIEITVMPC